MVLLRQGAQHSIRDSGRVVQTQVLDPLQGVRLGWGRAGAGADGAFCSEPEVEVGQLWGTSQHGDGGIQAT